MGESVFLKVVLVQALSILFVVSILKVVLDNMLADMAIKKLEFWREEDGTVVGVDRVRVITHKPIKKKWRQKLLRVFDRKYKNALTAEYVVDRRILGGMILKFGNNTVDLSVKDRLRQAYRGQP